MNTKVINIQALAFLGDAIFSLYIRKSLLEMGINKADLLQKKAVKYVSAKGEVRILQELKDKNILTKEEIELVRRGRNNKKLSHPKNTDIVTYKLSTGFEALLGNLYLHDKKRLQEILEKIEVQ